MGTVGPGTLAGRRRPGVLARVGLVGEDKDDGDLEGLAGLEGPGIAGGEDGVLIFLALDALLRNSLLELQRVGQGCT